MRSFRAAVALSGRTDANCLTLGAMPVMPLAGEAYDAKTHEFSLARTFAILEGLRGGGEGLRRAS